MRRFLTHLFWNIFAALFLGVEWLWMRLGAAVAWIVEALPIEPVRRWTKNLIDKLPPWAVLLVFVIPWALVEPLHFFAIFIFVRGQIFLGATLYVFSRVLGLGVIASLFDLCRYKLLQIGWFAKLYSWVNHILNRAHQIMDPHVARLKARMSSLKSRFTAWKRRHFGEGAWARRIKLWRRLALRKGDRRL